MLIKKYRFSFAIQSELLALRRAHLEISHQLETSNEEIRALSLRLQENVSQLKLYKQFNVNNTKLESKHKRCKRKYERSFEASL